MAEQKTPSSVPHLRPEGERRLFIHECDAARINAIPCAHRADLDSLIAAVEVEFAWDLADDSLHLLIEQVLMSRARLRAALDRLTERKPDAS